MMTGGPLTGLSDWKCRRKHLHDKKPEAGSRWQERQASRQNASAIAGLKDMVRGNNAGTVKGNFRWN